MGRFSSRQRPLSTNPFSKPLIFGAFPFVSGFPLFFFPGFSRSVLFLFLGPLRVRADFRKGAEESNFQFSESSNSLNGPDLFTELPFYKKSLPNPSFTECLPLFTGKPFSSLKSASSHPLPKSQFLKRTHKEHSRKGPGYSQHIS